MKQRCKEQSQLLLLNCLEEKMSQRRALCFLTHIYITTHLMWHVFKASLPLLTKLPTSAHTSGRMRPLPNSGRVICMSLKLVKVFAPSGRSWRKNRQKGAPEWKSPCKGWNKRNVNMPGIARHGRKQQEDVPFSPPSWSFMKVLILFLILSPERAKSSFVLKHNTIKNTTCRPWKYVNYNIRYTTESFFRGMEGHEDL